MTNVRPRVNDASENDSPPTKRPSLITTLPTKFFHHPREGGATVFTAGGKKVTFRDISAGEVFGEWSAIDNHPRSSSVVALSDAFVVSMSAGALKDMVTTRPDSVDLVRGSDGTRATSLGKNC